MSNKDEKARRKAILHALKEGERRSIQDGLPVSQSTMKSLFNCIDDRLSSSECDHTLRFAKEFLQTNGLSQEPIIDWLEEAGGHCDCEAIANAEALLEEAIRVLRRPHQ